MARKAFGRAGADITPDRGPSLSLRVLTGLSVGCFFRQGYDRPRILPESASGGVCTSTGPIGQGDASIDQIARVEAFGEPGIERGEGAGGVALARRCQSRARLVAARCSDVLVSCRRATSRTWPKSASASSRFVPLEPRFGFSASRTSGRATTPPHAAAGGTYGRGTGGSLSAPTRLAGAGSGAGEESIRRRLGRN